MFIAAVSIFLNIFLIVLIVVFIYALRPSHRAPPFVPVPQEIIPAIVKALDLKTGEIFYDLGSGDGRIVFACASATPEADCRGVEHNRLVYWLALWKKRKLRIKNAEFKRASFYNTSFSDADAIFTFLYPRTMDLLLPKLEKELRAGARLVSADFKFSKKEPEEVIELKDRENELGRRLYLYSF